jgi:chemotaxis protein methyltransferase CheR
MIDLVTTNKTDFFREPAHFEFLTTHILPNFLSSNSARQLKVWSAGCSSGEEPYTLAMVFNEYSDKNQMLNYTITATDLSTQVLNKAIAAVYNEERVAGIPLALKRKYFLKSKDPLKKTVRIVPQLRSRVNFERLNFMDDTLAVATKLKPGGYFFLGHSESITNMQVPLEQIRPTVFRKVG